MRRRSRIGLLVGAALACLALLTLGGAARAQEGGTPPTDDQVNRIAKQLYCPICENIPLDVCPSQACIQWRATIREKLAAGWSEEQIKQYFVDQYGDRVLATPPAKGLNWLVYVLPPALLLAGAVFLFRTLRRWRRLSEAAPTQLEAEAQEGDPYVQLLEEEIRRRA